MDHNVHFYWKFQTYFIAITTIAGSLLIPLAIVVECEFYNPLEHFSDFPLMRPLTFVFSAVWLCIGVSLFRGVYKQTKNFFYPFVTFYTLDLFLRVVRDVVLTLRNRKYFYSSYLNPVTFFIIVVLTFHIMMTLLITDRLFELDSEERRFKTHSNEQNREIIQLKKITNREAAGTVTVYQ